MHYWFKRYGNFSEWVCFAYWLSCIGEGLCLQPIRSSSRNVRSYVSPIFRPSKCPTFYTTPISGEKNVCQKALILTKLKLWQSVVISKLYNKVKIFDKIPYKYLVNTLIKLKNYFFLSFPWILHKKSVQILPKKKITTKHHMFGATKLQQTRKFYTTAGCDGWDI